VHPYVLETAVLYGCGRQSEVGISLNNDVMASNGIISTPQVTQKPQIGGNVGLCNDIRVNSYALETAYLYLKYVVYIIHGCEKQSEVDFSLNHHAMVSCSLHKLPRNPKSWPLGGWK
jgi:hypothetical protein